MRNLLSVSSSELAVSIERKPSQNQARSFQIAQCRACHIAERCPSVEERSTSARTGAGAGAGDPGVDVLLYGRR